MGAAAAGPAVVGRNIVADLMKQQKGGEQELIQRVVVTSVQDTLAGGFVVFIQRAGQGAPDGQGYRYLGPAPAVGDDALMFKVGTGYIVAGIDETVLDRMTTPQLVQLTTAETEVYSKVIPAYTLTTLRGVTLTDIVNGIDPASAATFTVRRKLNGVTFSTTPSALSMLASPGITVGNAFSIIPLGSLMSQIIVPKDAFSTTANTALALDATVDNTVSITIQNSSGGAGVVSSLLYAKLERE